MARRLPALPWWFQGILTVVLIAYVLYDRTNVAPSLETPPSPIPTPILLSTPTASPSAELFTVLRVTDGDTFKVLVASKSETVRIVGINTPETVDPRQPVQCFGKEASDQLKQLLVDQTVRLESDPTQADRDRYGRLLRFVFLPDGTDVGLSLITQGYAQQSLYSSKPHQYYETYIEAEKTAHSAEKGLWSPTACPPSKKDQE